MASCDWSSPKTLTNHSLPYPICTLILQLPQNNLSQNLGVSGMWHMTLLWWWVFNFSSGVMKPPFLFSGFEAEVKFLGTSESKALESLAEPAEFQGIVKRIFLLKWDGLWRYVSDSNYFRISSKMLNMEIINSLFSSQQGQGRFKLSSLEKKFE